MRATSVLAGLSTPIVLAPMAGGAGTPALAAAICESGGLGFLGSGYLAPAALGPLIANVRATTSRPFGVNLFVPGEKPSDLAALDAYAARVAAEAEAYGAPGGPARWDDDGWETKLEIVREARPAVVSFTFGCPSSAVVADLRDRGIEVWMTVTEPDEAVLAAGAGADALVVQGFEAGAHRGTFADADGAGEVGLLPLLRLVARAVDLPLVASGGLCDGWAVAAALVAGASAAQLGTAFLDTHEAATSPAHREALRWSAPTAITRAFSGRRARGIVNGFLTRHADAPSAYPAIHHLTSPLRAAARERGDAEMFNLWAGQAYPLMDHDVPAAAVMARLEREIQAALAAAASRRSSG